MTHINNNSSISEIINYLRKLEQRITKIENQLNIHLPDETKVEEMFPKEKLESTEIDTEESTDKLEIQIGQFWFAKMGIFVFAIGVALLLTFPYKNIPTFLPSLFGYILSVSIILLGYRWKKIYPHIAGYIFGGGLALLFFATLRLYFFSLQSVTTSTFLEVFLLLCITALSIILSLRWKSQYISGLSLSFGYISALVSGEAYFIFSLNVILAILIVFFKLKYEWNGLLIYGTCITYFTHLIWFLNNPIIGNELSIVSDYPHHLLFLLIYACALSLGILLRKNKLIEGFFVIINAFTNLAGCLSIFLIHTLVIPESNITIYYILASIIFLMLSVLFWRREKSKYSNFFYAMAGYFALSTAIIIQFDVPDFFVWLCWQSLLVISTAIWFRSKIIVIANFIIYVLIFLVFLALDGRNSVVNLSYGIVALSSARILNWRKEYLDLKTEKMRNAYLLTALFTIPYALYHLMPESLISVSWVMLAIFYYIMSVILNNKKYRWMALLTLLLTLSYVFIIGISSSDSTYRIVSFLVLGTALLLISIIYARNRTKTVLDKEITINEESKVTEE